MSCLRDFKEIRLLPFDRTVELAEAIVGGVYLYSTLVVTCWRRILTKGKRESAAIATFGRGNGRCQLLRSPVCVGSPRWLRGLLSSLQPSRRIGWSDKHGLA